MKKWINILLLLAVALFSLWCTGDLMRKNDQAFILAGAYDLAHGRMQEPSAYYQFDKTYVVYAACAAVFKIQQICGCLCSPVDAANVGLAWTFWSALTIFVMRFREKLSPMVLLCVITAPAILLNTLYVNSSVLSSALLLLSAVFIFQEGSRGGWPAALLFALAVGSRADVILLLPLLLWLITPFSMIGKWIDDFSVDCQSLRFLPHIRAASLASLGWKNTLKTGLAGFSKHWKIGAAGILALAAGRLFSCGGAAVDPFFNFKMVAGYTVFGFGAAGLLFAFYSVHLTLLAAKGRAWLERLYGFAGLFAFLLPVLFFIPQLHAPRYFWRGCEAILLLAVSGRLPLWNHRGVKSLLALTALLPLIAGVNLPSLSRPQLTVTSPTLFPSGDGFYPMGGYIPFMLRLRNTNEHPVDHNQLVWQAVHSAEFDFSPDGEIAVWFTPMYGYFMFEASLRGGSVRRATADEEAFYVDSRSLMRDDPKTPVQSLSDILNKPSQFVSPVVDGIGVLQVGIGDERWGRQTRLLNRLFAGSEYRIAFPEQAVPRNRIVVVFSEQPFETAQRDESTGWYYCGERSAFSISGTDCAVAVFPPWMSLNAFRSSGQ